MATNTLDDVRATAEGTGKRHQRQFAHNYAPTELVREALRDISSGRTSRQALKNPRIAGLAAQFEDGVGGKELVRELETLIHMAASCDVPVTLTRDEAFDRILWALHRGRGATI